MTIERIVGHNQAGLGGVAKFLLIAVCCVILWGEGALAGSIVRTLVEQKPGREYIIFQTTAPLAHKKVFLLQNPDRLVVDIERSEGQGVFMPSSGGAKLVRNIRFGQFDPTTSRIVVDLTAPVKTASLHQFSAAGSQPHRLVVEIEPRPGGALGGVQGVTQQARKDYPVPQQKPIVAPKPTKPIVVIDAGHGGKDPGAHGSKGSWERQITLAYALALRKELLRTGRYDVVMTRETDEFILLHERVNLARRAKGSVFISLHADSAPGGSKARGLSVYTLSETASDEEAAALAARENQSDVIDGLDLGAEVDKEVADILIDLTQRETKNKSAELADVMVEHFTRQGIRLLPNTHRYAGFRVLKAPDIPSVLVETGFLSHPEDEALLKSEAYKLKIIRGIIYGLDGFFAK